MQITVVIPNFNRTLILKRAIDSVLVQSYSVDEIIIVDDCSDAAVRDFLRRHIDPIQKVTIIYNKINLGPSECRNIGVESSKSPYIAFLDSDDIWTKYKLEKQKKLFECNPEVNLVYCAQSTIELFKGNVLNHLLDGWVAPNPSTLLFKKEMYMLIGGFDKELRACEDHDFWMKFSIQGYLVDFVDEELAYFKSDANNRLSFYFDLRIAAVEMFYNKWKEIIIERRSYSHYNNMKENYILQVVYPIFLNSIASTDIRTILIITYKYFLFNRYFYNKVFNSIIKRVKRKYRILTI
jgi:glycosyltransferase involved in cell wall biosynthesis